MPFALPLLAPHAESYRRGVGLRHRCVTFVTFRDVRRTGMRRGMIRLLPLILLLPLAIAACSPLKTFDALVPKDGGGELAERGIDYGTDPRQKLDVYVPKATGTERPVVVFIYGGSWSSGTRDGYQFAGRALAAQGFVVVIPDYRLVPQVRFPGFVQDGAAAVRWAMANAARFGGDGQRIVLMGHSAGAHIAAMLALDEQWLGQDRVAVRGFVGLAGPYDFLPLDPGAAQNALGNWPRPAETQPITYAGAGDPPTLLLAGAKDDTVKPRNSTALADKLKSAGVDATATIYPKVGHVGIVTALSEPFRGKAPVLADTAAFVRRVTRQ